jgi:[ribosomal protein S5]-alanine N-acetyltransferase
MPFPSLTTNQYTLRQLHNADAPSVYILRTDEKVNQYLDRQIASSIDDVVAFIQKINDNESFYWVICKHDNASLMGTICLFNIDTEKSKAEIGYELLPAFQGKGVLREVMPAVIGFAFEIIGIREIEACVHQSNLTSIKLLDKNGFTPGGQADGDQMVCYTLTAGKWRH